MDKNNSVADEVLVGLILQNSKKIQCLTGYSQKKYTILKKKNRICKKSSDKTHRKRQRSFHEDRLTANKKIVDRSSLSKKKHLKLLAQPKQNIPTSRIMKKQLKSPTHPETLFHVAKLSAPKKLILLDNFYHFQDVLPTAKIESLLAKIRDRKILDIKSAVNCFNDIEIKKSVQSKHKSLIKHKKSKSLKFLERYAVKFAIRISAVMINKYKRKKNSFEIMISKLILWNLKNANFICFNKQVCTSKNRINTHMQEYVNSCAAFIKCVHEYVCYEYETATPNKTNKKSNRHSDRTRICDDDSSDISNIRGPRGDGHDYKKRPRDDDDCGKRPRGDGHNRRRISDYNDATKDKKSRHNHPRRASSRDRDRGRGSTKNYSSDNENQDRFIHYDYSTNLGQRHNSMDDLCGKRNRRLFMENSLLKAYDMMHPIGIHRKEKSHINTRKQKYSKGKDFKAEIREDEFPGIQRKKPHKDIVEDPCKLSVPFFRTKTKTNELGKCMSKEEKKPDCRKKGKTTESNEHTPIHKKKHHQKKITSQDKIKEKTTTSSEEEESQTYDKIEVESNTKPKKKKYKKSVSPVNKQSVSSEEIESKESKKKGHKTSIEKKKKKSISDKSSLDEDNIESSEEIRKKESKENDTIDKDNDADKSSLDLTSESDDEAEETEVKEVIDNISTKEKEDNPATSIHEIEELKTEDELINTTDNKEHKEIIDTTSSKDQKEITDTTDNEEQKKLIDTTDNEGQKELIDTIDNEGQKELIDTTDNEGQKELIDTTDIKGKKELIDTTDIKGQKELIDTTDIKGQKELIDTTDIKGQKELIDTTDIKGQKELIDTTDIKGQKELIDTTDIKEKEDVPDNSDLAEDNVKGNAAEEVEPKVKGLIETTDNNENEENTVKFSVDKKSVHDKESTEIKPEGEEHIDTIGITEVENITDDKSSLGEEIVSNEELEVIESAEEEFLNTSGIKDEEKDSEIFSLAEESFSEEETEEKELTDHEKTIQEKEGIKLQENQPPVDQGDYEYVDNIIIFKDSDTTCNNEKTYGTKGKLFLFPQVKSKSTAYATQKEDSKTNQKKDNETGCIYKHGYSRGKSLNNISKCIIPHINLMPHAVDMVCSASLKAWALWVKKVAESAKVWCDWINTVICDMRQITAIMQGDVYDEHGVKTVLTCQDWTNFVQRFDSDIRVWRHYNKHVQKYTEDILNCFNFKRVTCCSLCRQQNLQCYIKNAVHLYEKLSIAIQTTKYWRTWLHSMVLESQSLFELIEVSGQYASYRPKCICKDGMIHHSSIYSIRDIEELTP